MSEQQTPEQIALRLVNEAGLPRDETRLLLGFSIADLVAAERADADRREKAARLDALHEAATLACVDCANNEDLARRRGRYAHTLSGVGLVACAARRIHALITRLEAKS